MKVNPLSSRAIALLLLLERPMYGQEIELIARERSQGVIVPPDGALYPLLYRLCRDKLATMRVEPKKAGGRPRKVYALTAKGRAEAGRVRVGILNVLGVAQPQLADRQRTVAPLLRLTPADVERLLARRQLQRLGLGELLDLHGKPVRPPGFHPTKDASGPCKIVLPRNRACMHRDGHGHPPPCQPCFCGPQIPEDGCPIHDVEEL